MRRKTTQFEGNQARTPLPSFASSGEEGWGGGWRGEGQTPSFSFASHLASWGLDVLWAPVGEQGEMGLGHSRKDLSPIREEHSGDMELEVSPAIGHGDCVVQGLTGRDASTWSPACHSECPATPYSPP